MGERENGDRIDFNVVIGVGGSREGRSSVPPRYFEWLNFYGISNPYRHSNTIELKERNT